MTDEKMREYSLKISQASKTGLVVITDEIILDYIQDAKAAFEEDDKETFRFSLKKARQFVDELTMALDMKFEVSLQLMRLYSYVKKCLIHSSAQFEAKELDSAAEVISELKKAFEEVEKSDNSGTVMSGSQKVYAGLTYGPGSKLNEVVF